MSGESVLKSRTGVVGSSLCCGYCRMSARTSSAAGEARVDVEHVGADADLARRRRPVPRSIPGTVVRRRGCGRRFAGNRRQLRRRGRPPDWRRARATVDCRAARRRRAARRIGLHPRLGVEVQQEPEPDPQEHADLRVHARRASGTGSIAGAAPGMAAADALQREEIAAQRCRGASIASSAYAEQVG